MVKKSLIYGSSLAVATLLFTGCGIKTQEYNVSADNVSQLRAYEGIKINVSEFSATKAGEKSTLCRMAETITTPKGESFEKYIQEALVAELKMANLYDKTSNLTISGNIEKIYGSSMIGDAFWEVSVTIKSSNGKSIKVDTKREYPSAVLAYTACNNMASSFSPTIKQLVNDIINHKDFKSLITN
ncbi:MAG: hypothetical protein RBR23_10365 [Arcobacteraceae bacterium]|jgi:hypothetical protein|nr:hypothetical protein [Arcobacteraceae bacterium]